MTPRRAFHPIRSTLRRLAPALLAVAAPAAATTVAPLSDPVLVDGSSTIVVAHVEGRLPASSDRPVTDWLVIVERALKGAPAESALVVRVPGGEDAAGRRLTLHGAPRFARGQRVLLFLEPRADGTWAIAQFLQGAFHEVRSDGRDAAVRDLTEVRVVRTSRRRAAGRAPRLRDFSEFTHWIEDRVAGVRRDRAYFFRPSTRQMKAITSHFTLFEEGGLNLRWFQFDTGGSVAWRAHQDGQPGLPEGGFTEFQRALGVWNGEPTTPVNLQYGGTTSASAGFQNFDNQNVLLFDDPNQDIEGTFDCSEGGTLAIGGPWSDSSNTGRFNGRTWIRISGGDVVMNDGIECSLGGSTSDRRFMEEVYAHEVGHTLGLGHSSENENEPSAVLREALMFFQAHDDGRGARLNADDQRGLQTLYRRSTGPTGCPQDTLCLLGGRFHVTATWENQFNGRSGVAGAVRNTDVSGFMYFDDGANIELIVKILDFGSVFKVFYGQLTNLRFNMTVTDTSTGESRTYSNTAGECGAIDQNAFPNALTLPLTARTRRAQGGGGSCRPDATTLCLQGKRIQVRGTWRNQYNGTSGTAQAKALTQVTGGLYFLDRSNLEILVKAVDFGSYFLLIYGSLSDFEYHLTVTDTVSGISRTYDNPPGRYCGALDGTTFQK